MYEPLTPPETPSMANTPTSSSQRSPDSLADHFKARYDALHAVHVKLQTDYAVLSSNMQNLQNDALQVDRNNQILSDQLVTLSGEKKHSEEIIAELKIQRDGFLKNRDTLKDVLQLWERKLDGISRIWTDCVQTANLHQILCPTWTSDYSSELEW
jgi:hypothetical protein